MDSERDTAEAHRVPVRENEAKLFSRRLKAIKRELSGILKAASDQPLTASESYLIDAHLEAIQHQRDATQRALDDPADTSASLAMQRAMRGALATRAEIERLAKLRAQAIEARPGRGQTGKRKKAARAGVPSYQSTASNTVSWLDEVRERSKTA